MDSPDELPSGWTVLCKVLRTGREVSIYTNLETGKRFFSKDDLFKHIKAGNSHSAEPLPVSKDIGRLEESTSGKPEPVSEKDEHPEWLPDGWKIELRLRKSGVHSGKEYKCYIDTSSSGKFYSKQEVMRYLETVKGKKHAIKDDTEKHGRRKFANDADTLEEEAGTLENEPDTLEQETDKLEYEMDSEHKTKKLEESTSEKPVPVDEKDELPEWLPNGWKIELRIRKSGVHFGKEYKCYIDPSNNGKFYSKQEVLRYLETVKHKKHTHQNDTEKPVSRKLEKETDTHEEDSDTLELETDSEHKVIVQRCVVEDLPSGWIKEIKIRQTSNTIRKDPFYTDPVSGYVFRSKKEALRYVQTGVIGKNAFKPKNPTTGVPEKKKDEVSTSSPVSRQKSKNRSSKGHLFSGKKGSEMSNSEHSKSEDAVISITKVSPIVRITVSSGDEIVQAKCPLDDSTPNCGQSKKKSTKNSSPLLIDEESNRGKSEKSPSSDAAVPDKGRGVTENGHVSTPTPENVSAKEAWVNPKNSTGKKVHDLPPRSSKRLAGHEPDIVANLELGERALISAIKKSKKTEAVLDSSPTSDGSDQVEIKPDAKFADCASHKAKTLTVKDSRKKSTSATLEEIVHHKTETEKTDKDPELQFSFLFGSDPCLEFAFKTLTGELPLDDTSQNETTQTNPSTFRHENVLKSETTKQTSRSKPKNKKELNLPRRSSKRLSGGVPELPTTSLANEPSRQSNKRERPFDINVASSREKPQKRETGKAQLEKLESEPTCEPKMPQHDYSFSIADYWSDPCLDFAFKTLTGVIPIEDTLVQGYFHEQVDVSKVNNNDNATLPGFGSPSFFQTESSQFDVPEKSSAGFTSCSGVRSQQSLETNKDLHQKVKS